MAKEEYVNLCETLMHPPSDEIVNDIEKTIKDACLTYTVGLVMHRINSKSDPTTESSKVSIELKELAKYNLKEEDVLPGELYKQVLKIKTLI